MATDPRPATSYALYQYVPNRPPHAQSPVPDQDFASFLRLEKEEKEEEAEEEEEEEEEEKEEEEEEEKRNKRRR